MKPILFSTQMVQAIMDGRKTMTRRIIKPQPAIMANSKPLDGYNDSMIKAAGNFPMPKYKPGDVLWVRETWADVFGKKEYRADFTDAENEYRKQRYGIMISRWKPSIHMPRSAARLFLRVVSVSAERLQSITAKDAQAEGVGRLFEADIAYDDKFTDIPFKMGEGLAVHQFARLWDSLNAHRNGGAYAWDRSPWVWVISFERIECPE